MDVVREEEAEDKDSLWRLLEKLREEERGRLKNVISVTDILRSDKQGQIQIPNVSDGN